MKQNYIDESGALNAEEVQPTAAESVTPASSKPGLAERAKAKLDHIKQTAAEYDRENIPFYTDASRVRYSEVIDPQHFLLKEGATEFFPKGELIVVSGKLKHGKTHWCEELCCSLLGHSRFGYEALRPDCRIGWIDTEQSRYDAQAVLVRIYDAASLKEDTPDEKIPFLLHSFRGFGVDERLRRIEDYLSKVKLDVIFIDGVADLLVNYNDVNESQNLIMNYLLRWSAVYGCAVVCVMHENKAADNTLLKGHLGTLLGQKLSEQYSVTREEVQDGLKTRYIFKIKMEESRGGYEICKRQAEFDDEGHFVPSRYEPPRYDVELAEKVRACFQALQSTALAPKDLYEEFERQFGKKKNGKLSKRVGELEGYVFYKVGSGPTTKYVLIDT